MEALEKRVPTAQTSSGFFSNIPHHWQAPMEALLLTLKLMHDTVQGIERKFHTLPARARSINFLILPKPLEVRNTHRIINPRGFMLFYLFPYLIFPTLLNVRFILPVDRNPAAATSGLKNSPACAPCIFQQVPSSRSCCLWRSCQSVEVV